MADPPVDPKVAAQAKAQMAKGFAQGGGKKEPPPAGVVHGLKHYDWRAAMLHRQGPGMERFEVRGAPTSTGRNADPPGPWQRPPKVEKPPLHNMAQALVTNRQRAVVDPDAQPVEEDRPLTREERIQRRHEIVEQRIEARQDKVRQRIEARHELIDKRIEARHEKVADRIQARHDRVEQRIEHRHDLIAERREAVREVVGKRKEKALGQAQALAEAAVVFGAPAVGVNPLLIAARRGQRAKIVRAPRERMTHALRHYDWRAAQKHRAGIMLKRTEMFQPGFED